MCSMRELVILAALVSALHAASLPTDTDVVHKCQEDQDNIATLEAESFINDHHHHGYKFKFVSLDSRSAEEKTDPCEVILGITLEETECHIVNPKPLDQCTTRKESETKVTAKCNVTISSVEGKAAVKRYTCETEPASHEILVTKCPDCSSLLPLHDLRALESVKTALQKFNKESNHKSYFKLMEVGRISTQCVVSWILAEEFKKWLDISLSSVTDLSELMDQDVLSLASSDPPDSALLASSNSVVSDITWMFTGQSFFADFAIMETNCTNKEEEACKALCGDHARYGFCKSSKVGNEEPEVECEIYEAQNITHPMKHPAQSRKDCKFHDPPPGHRPGHHPGHVHPHRPEHAGHDHKDKIPGHRDHPEHPHLCPKDPSGVPESAPEGRHEFPCHGVVKIPPSIYPICPFPPPRLCRGPPDLVPLGTPPPPPQ